MELSELINERKLLSRVKKGLIKNFCGSDEGKDWFMNLYMSIMSFSLTELIDEIRKEYPDINLPLVIDAYYKKDAEYLVFPWDTQQNLGEENESSDHEEAVSREEEESWDGLAEDNREDQNEDTMDLATNQAEKEELPNRRDHQQMFMSKCLKDLQMRLTDIKKTVTLNAQG